jgi:hypothetical protein
MFDAMRTTRGPDTRNARTDCRPSQRTQRWKPLGSNGCMVSALGKIRTCDTRFRKPVLYPLSYEGKML